MPLIWWFKYFGTRDRLDMNFSTRKYSWTSHTHTKYSFICLCAKLEQDLPWGEMWTDECSVWDHLTESCILAYLSWHIIKSLFLCLCVLRGTLLSFSVYRFLSMTVCIWLCFSKCLTFGSNTSGLFFLYCSIWKYFRVFKNTHTHT